MKKIVITGGPCSGKTSVINELYKIGYPILEETAKEIVAARKNIPLTKEESDIRQELIFNTQLAKENEAEKKNYDIIFLDRGLIDGLAYSLLYSREDSIQRYLPIVEKQRYDFVFILDLLPFRPEGFRSENENENEARRIHNSIEETYKMFGYKPVSVPVMRVEGRVGFILEKLFGDSIY